MHVRRLHVVDQLILADKMNVHALQKKAMTSWRCSTKRVHFINGGLLAHHGMLLQLRDGRASAHLRADFSRPPHSVDRVVAHWLSHLALLLTKQ
mmetsp:Transcript_33026/g.61397  ORF Transcript_33026/g.61397 Transcript_33026/m.61397 type:complete len:94 (+) Transcript_33026:18-299(+)